jgi:Avidin family
MIAHEKLLSRTLKNEAQDTSMTFQGVWQNELGSQVEFKQAGNALTGSYRSAVSGGGHQTTGTLVGYANGNLISFVVYWTAFQAITAWVGQYDTDSSTINTLWQMTNTVESEDDLWESINAGADTFTFLLQ